MEILRGRVKFPTGGTVRDPLWLLPVTADLVKFQNRQYSLDERRKRRLKPALCLVSKFLVPTLYRGFFR